MPEWLNEYPAYGKDKFYPERFDKMRKIASTPDFDVHFNDIEDTVAVVRSGDNASSKNLIAFASYDSVGCEYYTINVFVEPEFRRRGIGMLIYVSILNTGQTLGAINTLNSNSVRLWNRMIDNPNIETWATKYSDKRHAHKYNLSVVNGKPEPNDTGVSFSDIKLFAKLL